MSELDRIETNFRLSMISQREQTAELRSLAAKVNELTSVVTRGLSEVANGLVGVAEKSEQTADRLEESVQLMRSFAEGQAEIRQTLTQVLKRLDALESKQAS